MIERLYQRMVLKRRTSAVTKMGKSPCPNARESKKLGCEDISEATGARSGSEMSEVSRRVCRLTDHATLVLGSSGRALDWIQHYSATLSDKPINLAWTEEGLAKALLHLSNISRHPDSGW